jgi:alpha-tubulin suppressor-like RCC1 family protein
MMTSISYRRDRRIATPMLGATICFAGVAVISVGSALDPHPSAAARTVVRIGTVGFLALPATFAAMFATSTVASQYDELVYRPGLGHGHLPLGVVSLFVQLGCAPAIVVLPPSLLLFPDGDLRSRPWRLVLVGYSAVGGLYLAGLVAVTVVTVAGHPIRVGCGGDLVVAAWLGTLQDLLLPLRAAASLLFVARQAWSYRGASGQRRAQLRWLMSPSGTDATASASVMAPSAAASGRSLAAGVLPLFDASTPTFSQPRRPAIVTAPPSTIPKATRILLAVGRFRLAGWMLSVALCALPFAFASVAGAVTTGTVSSFGNDEFGQLGNGAGGSSATPVAVAGLSGVVQIDGGREHALALKSDGTVWAWGHNNYGEVGDGTKTNRQSPVQVKNLTGVTAVETGHYTSMALKSDGTVWMWGWNKFGTLGDGTTTNRTTPVQVKGLTKVIAIAGARDHSLALEANGTVWAWGDNEFGNLGTGNTTNSLVPVQVHTLANVVAIAGGRDHSLAIESNGTVWSWGWNQYGQVGNGTKGNNVLSPVQVSGLTGVTMVSAGADHSMALKSDGTVWAWGQNNDGQLGDGTKTNRATPVKVSGLANVTDIGNGRLHSLAIEGNGSAWAWGLNTDGQLGDGTKTNRATPVQVKGITGAFGLGGGVNYSIVLHG